jgi:hypothetical protein
VTRLQRLRSCLSTRLITRTPDELDAAHHAFYHSSDVCGHPLDAPDPTYQSHALPASQPYDLASLDSPIMYGYRFSGINSNHESLDSSSEVIPENWGGYPPQCYSLKAQSTKVLHSRKPCPVADRRVLIRSIFLGNLPSFP